MRKRAIDLSLEELAAMGANAAFSAAQRAYDAGLSVAGKVEVLHADGVVSSLVERRPSGAVTALGVGTSDAPAEAGVPAANKASARSSAD